MDEITLLTATDDRRGPRDKFELESESVGDPVHEAKRWVGAPTLDVGDVAA